MKKDNRGFLLAESLVVSTFVLTVLILLYIQFSNLTTNYKNSYNYNNVESIYDLSSVAKYLQNNGYDLSTKISASKPYVFVFKDGSCNIDAGIIDNFCDNLVSKMGAKSIIYTSSDISVIKNYISKNADSNLNQKLRDFISRVETNTILNKGRLFAEFDNGTFATIAINNTVGSLPETPSTKNVGGIEVPIITSGDGLYADAYETGKYTYKGANPNNYITFNNELWRIISVESDGTIKILRNTILKDNTFDGPGTRTVGYCSLGEASSNGCNAWSSTAHIVGSPAEFINGSFKGSVDADSEILTYLNGEYYNGITSGKDKIVNHNFNVGSVTSDNNDLAAQITNENSYKWNGKVGLITNSDYIKANSNQSTCGTLSLINSNYNTCKNTNWMYISSNSWWTLSPRANYTYYVWSASSDSRLGNNTADNIYGVRPALYLAPAITLTGSGTAANPFKIS